MGSSGGAVEGDGTGTGGDAGDVAAIDLGPQLTPIPFVAGRYAAAVEKSLSGTHARNWIGESSTATFVLELGADGAATACRGWSYDFSNDGPEVHSSARFRDQQGYRGRFVEAAGVVRVELDEAGDVCPRVRQSSFELRRTAHLPLECVLARPTGHPQLTTPVLLCRWGPVVTDEARAHLVPELVADGWMVLGPGNGLRIAITGQPPGSQVGEPTQVVVTASPTPLAPALAPTP